MTSLIPQDNTWLVWAVILGMSAFAIVAEQKWKWAQTLTAAIIAIFASMILTNIRVIPATSPVYNTVMSYILPLSIPMLLFKCDIKKIIRESGRLFLIVNVAMVGTCISALVMGKIFKGVPNIQGIIAMQVGAYAGGTVNMVALGNVFKLDPAYINAAAVVANMFVVLIMMVYNFMCISKWFRKKYNHPHIDAFEAGIKDDTSGKSSSELYWKPKPISLRDLAVTLATDMIIVAVSSVIAKVVSGTGLHESIKLIFGNVYLLMSTITILGVTLFPKYFASLNGADELGNLMIMMFFVALGCTGDWRLFLQVGPVIIITAFVILSCNLGIVLAAGKLLKWNLEEIITCSNSTIGGPTTAAAFAVAKGWNSLIAPGLLVGLYGYAIANYIGVLIASLV
ncbi:MAG: DUF819 family protein [Clostridiaceae bacterium]|jgi:uncharacterized membrane protein|nr:DUF819 family protein [Clostridiaceae bacterium]